MSSISVAGDTSGSISITAPLVAGSGVLTLPVATDTLVGKATTDTLTNKSIAVTQLTGTLPVANGGTGVTTSTGSGANVLGTSPTMANTQFIGNQNVGTLQNSTGSLGGLQVMSAGNTDAAFLCFHKPGNFASYFGIDTDNYFAVGGWSAGAGLANFKCGAISKSSGSFCIDHPLPTLQKTHNLVHSFVESPQADNLYRGKATLINGTATVNIDEIAAMTEGTFVLLNREVQCFTSNEADWDAVCGFVNGNILTIKSQNQNSTATISWLVIGERQDKHMYDTDWTDENGKVLVEPLKKTTSLGSNVDLTKEAK